MPNIATFDHDIYIYTLIGDDSTFDGAKDLDVLLDWLKRRSPKNFSLPFSEYIVDPIPTGHREKTILQKQTAPQKPENGGPPLEILNLEIIIFSGSMLVFWGRVSLTCLLGVLTDIPQSNLFSKFHIFNCWGGS